MFEFLKKHSGADAEITVNEILDDDNKIVGYEAYDSARGISAMGDTEKEARAALEEATAKFDEE